MRQNSGSIGYSGAHTSPGTPEYGDTYAEIPKPWSSERVPLPASSSSRRHISAAALMPFNSGRTLPSKWDDAERWITSPVSGHGSVRTTIAQHQRQPKSKSGPLGLPGLSYASNCSPSMPGNVRNFKERPLTDGVLIPEGISIQYDSMDAANCGESKSNISTNVLCLSDLETEGNSRDDKASILKEEEARVLRDVYHRDSATQMSPEGSTRSSSDGRFSFSTMPSLIHSSFSPRGTSVAYRDEVRDVQVDRGTTTPSQGKKRGSRKMKKTLTNMEALHLPWNASETSKNASKLQREEAKIAAWENLQKAKAEASIRELEMKLEKKRSASMDKILNKLRASQIKAESMRNSLSENRLASNRRVSGCTYFNLDSLCNWFLCRKN